MERIVAVLLGLLILGAEAARGQALSANEVEIVTEAFGVGRVVRVGEWCGIRVGLKDSSDRPRDVLIVVEGHDADGDKPLYQRIIPTDPTSGAAGRWMYVFIPPGYPLSTRGLSIAAYEAAEDGEIQDRPRGRRLGSARLMPQVTLSANEGLMGVVSQDGKTLGLQLYSRSLAPGDTTPPTGHERSQIAAGLTPRDLPDHWAGLAPFSVLVWSEGNPADLTEEASNALVEWVRRGGHLVVVVPRVAQWWDNATSNRLHAISPRVALTREEGVAMEPYRGLLTDRRDLALPSNAVRYTFDPAGSDPSEANRLIDAPDGRCIVARRNVGAGHVTLVGLDLAHAGLSGQGLPEPDVFWHRILGRRGMLPTDAELDSMKANFGFRTRVYVDRELDREIAKSGRAAAGIALGFVVFVAYWLVAGPIGYTVLRRTGNARHAWSSFVACAGLFTGLAWGGAMALRPARIEGSHVTFLDAIYGQPTIRTRTWASLLIPYYGEADLGVGRVGEGAFRDVLSPWESDQSTVSAGGSFPDLRSYGVNARAPSGFRVPVRSTVKQVRTDWAGEPPMGWTFPHPTEEGEGGARVRIGEQGRLQGEIVHALPAPLRDAIVIVNLGQVVIGTNPGFGSTARVFRVDEWRPGVPMDLEKLTSLSGTETFLRRYIDEELSDRVAKRLEFEGSLDAGTRSSLLVAMSLYSMLAPPDYVTDQTGQARLQISRRETHAVDLSTWLTQPCLIVIGHLGTGGDRLACPTPLSVDGADRSDRVTGRTVVRWVYPLPDAPPAYRAATDPVADAP